jgi:hypothetical protein
MQKTALQRAADLSASPELDEPHGDTNDTKSPASDIPTIPMLFRLASVIGCGEPNIQQENSDA